MREGIFDDLLEMDKMPVTGSVMTYSSDNVVPDSANPSAAWSTGNKTFNGALGVFADGTNCRWRQTGVSMATMDSLIDNPRVETLWEYLKRKYNYRTGIVSTADVILGGGTNQFQAAYRTDKRDLIGEFHPKGYS